MIRNMPDRDAQDADLGAPTLDADGDISAARVKPDERSADGGAEDGSGH